MNGTQTFIIECGRINSVGVSGGGEDFNNKSSWTNKTAPILLKQGDTVSLQNVLINVGGADTNAIQFQGVASTPTQNLQDNFTLIQVGYYINHNGIYTSALPLKYTNREGSNSGQNTLKMNNFTTMDNGSGGLTNRSNNDLGRFYNYQYFSGDSDGDELQPIQARISRIDKIESINPFLPMDGKKYAIIHPNYEGWCRPSTDKGNSADQVSNIKLLTQDIPILLPKGFISPNGIADLMTNVLSYTSPEFRNVDELFVAWANRWKQDETAQADKIPLYQYKTNGYTYKTIKCNLQGNQHKIYGTMAVDEPFQWLYGTQILSNSATDNLVLQNRYFKTLHSGQARVDYPSIIWQRFIGNDPTDFDLGIEGRTGQYSNYSPFKTTMMTGGDDELIEISAMTSTFSDFNDYYRNQATTDNDGYWLAQISSTSYRQVKNSVIGTNLQKTAIWVDNDAVDKTSLIAWRRFYTLKDTWDADEHQIFKTTDLGMPNVGNSNPYQFSGAGAGQPSETWFAYDLNDNRTIFMGADIGGLGFTGYVHINNILTEDSGGIVAGGKYKLSCTLEIDEGSWNNTRIYFGGNASTGFPDQSWAENRNVEIEWTATNSFIGASALYMSVYYSNIGAVVKVSNISILRENTVQDDTYALSNVWDNNHTNPENNKIYSIIKNGGTPNIQCIITNNQFNNDANRTYKLVALGLVGVLNGQTFSLVSGGNSFSNIGVFINDDDANYTYWVFYYANLWVAYRLTKYQGGIPTANDIIGDTTGQSASIMKNTNRNGQQYYNFAGTNPWSDSGSPIYDYSSGNDFSNVTPGNYASLRFFDTPGNAGGNIGYYDGYWTNPLNLAQRVYYRYNPQGDNTKISGTAYYPPSDPAPYWQRQWSFDITTGTNGTFTQVYTDGSSATYEPSGALSVTYPSITFTSHIADPLPLTDTDKEYFATCIVDGITYHLGANDNGNGDDTDKEGKRGRLIYSIDGGQTFILSTWDWNGTNLLNMNGNGRNIPLTNTNSGLITLSNVFQYDISQTIDNVIVPTDGRGYGNFQELYGTTATALTGNVTEYLGFNTNTQPNNVEVVMEGYCYDTANASFANNNGKKWELRSVGDDYSLTLRDDASGIVILTLTNNGTGVLTRGWTIIQADKKLDSEISGSGADGIIYTNCNIQGYFTSTTEALNNGQHGPNTTGEDGTPYNVFTDGRFNQNPADNGDFKTFLGADLRTDEADIVKNQLLMTNIKLTEGNLNKIRDWFRYNETYSGTKTTRSDIRSNPRAFYVLCDLGRSKDDHFDFSNTNASENQTGRTPWIPNYMRDQGIMGVDNGDADNVNMGCVCPVYHSTGMDENRVKIYTGWVDDFENRIVADGMFGDKTGNNTNYCYGNSLTTTQFKTGYKKADLTFIDTSELYNKCVNENIGIIPFICKDTEELMIGFEAYNDDRGIYKIQNLTYFGYSPSVIDHKYVSIFNNDAPAIKNSDGGDYNYTSDIRDQMNFINVGATQPTVQYNTDVNKFTFRYWHTPTFFNKETGTDTNIGQEIAKLFDNSPAVIFRDFCYPRSPEWLAFDDRVNVGINDSQSGIFLRDIYYQKVQSDNSQVSNHSNSIATLMTADNFYNTLWFKLGFSYNDLKPIKFIWNAFNQNRFGNLTYNNVSTQFRQMGVVPFTTNSLFNINFAPLINIFSQNSGESGTENANKGTEKYGLGYNNGLKADVQVESDSLFPSSIPVNISSGYYRIYTDLPIDTLTYTADSNLAVIGSALLNYASSQQFFFSYGMDYGATITKDTLINNVKIEIRDDRGTLIEGLGDRSLVVIKITRAIQLTEPPPDPEVKELQDIEDDIEELVKETKEENMKDSLDDADAQINAAGIGDALSHKETKSQIDAPDEIRAFVDNFNIQMIQNLVSRTLIRVRDDNKDIGRRLANGIAEWFLRKDNIREFNRITKDLFNDGIDATLGKPYVAKFVESMNKFYINVEGKALKGAKRMADVASITDEGAQMLYRAISQAIGGNEKLKVGALSAILFEDINTLFGLDDIKVYDSEDPGVIEATQLPDDDMTLEDFEVGTAKSVGRGFKDSVKGELKRQFLDYGSVENYLNLYGFVTKEKGNIKLKEEAMEEIKESGPDLDNLRDLYRDAGKFLLQDNPNAFSETMRRMNAIIEDVIGTRLYAKFSAILEQTQSAGPLTGTGPQKARKQTRRQKKEIAEAREKGGEWESKKYGGGEEEGGALESNVKRKKTPHDAYYEDLKRRGLVKNRGDMAKLGYRKEFDRLRVAWQKLDPKYGGLGKKYGGRVESRLKHQSPVGYEAEKEVRRGRGRPRIDRSQTAPYYGEGGSGK
jgi:hypothetical protein